MNDNGDEEYKDLRRAERRAKKILKKNNYRHQHLDCCATCRSSYDGCQEESLKCILAQQEKWQFGEVDPLSICDLYGARI